MMKKIQFLLVITAFLMTGFPLGAQKYALILIDIQDFYFPGGDLPLDNPEAAATNAGLVLEQFRETGNLVVHVRHDYEPGGDIQAFVTPAGEERVFTKKEVNAFLNTGLKDYLDENGITGLVICGMQTHMCVEAAVRAAHDLGYTVILVADACTTRTLQYQDKIITAENVHLSTLKTLKGSYCTVVNTDEILKDFQNLLQSDN